MKPEIDSSGGLVYNDVIYPLERDLPSISPSIGSPESLPRIIIPGELLKERAVGGEFQLTHTNSPFHCNKGINCQGHLQ